MFDPFEVQDLRLRPSGHSLKGKGWSEFGSRQARKSGPLSPNAYNSSLQTPLQCPGQSGSASRPWRRTGCRRGAWLSSRARLLDDPGRRPGPSHRLSGRPSLEPPRHHTLCARLEWISAEAAFFAGIDLGRIQAHRVTRLSSLASRRKASPSILRRSDSVWWCRWGRCALRLANVFL